jgi:signal transduction histidine kinase
MLWVVIAALCVVIVIQFLCIHNTKKQVHEISCALDDIRDGNLDRRLLANENTIFSELVYKMNDIVIRDKEKLLEIDKSEKAYKKFVTSLSHDIRTPLASLIGYLEVLESNSVTKNEHDKFLEIAKTKALSLSDYIQSLFQWLKLESGEWIYDFEEENICELTRIVLADWIIKLEKSSMKYEFNIPNGPIYLLLDKSAYERIINNILSNIMKHSHADYLEINLKHTDTEVTIEISDNGVGISEEDLPFIFDRLYKCDNSRTENSNGLGLAIVKELISSLNGSITVSSKVNKGTAFSLKFPINMNKK